LLRYKVQMKDQERQCADDESERQGADDRFRK